MGSLYTDRVHSDFLMAMDSAPNEMVSAKVFFLKYSLEGIYPLIGIGY